MSAATATASAANINNWSSDFSAAIVICGLILKVAYDLKRNLVKVTACEPLTSRMTRGSVTVAI